MTNKVLDKAIHLIMEGNSEEGLALIKENQSSFTDDEKYNIAQYYMQLGLVNEAKSVLMELLYLYPNESELIVSLAEVHIDLDEEDDAIELLENLDAKDEAYPQSLMLLADLYQSQGLFEVSERKLLEAKTILQNEPIIDIALGELYLSQGDYRRALPLFQGAKDSSEIVEFPLDVRIAECYSGTGNFEEALPFYDKALQKELNIDTLFQYGFTAFQAGYYKTAIEKLNEVKQIDFEYASLYLYLAKAYEHEGALEDSLRTAKEGLGVNEYNKELQLYAAKMALKLNHVEEAERLLREAIALDPGYVEAATTLTKLFLQVERFEDVVECIQELEKFGEYDPRFDWDLARAKEGLEQYSDALNHYRQAYTSYKDDISFLHDYAFFLYEEGRLQEAKPLFETLLQHDPTNTELLDIYARMND
ncbi:MULTISPECIES: tetratricopeptide repeat protein [Bacillus]|uniref:tetratricopeptide repeat protein n=1 Tax=Bacillus TaxID=1386 RepID=UPI000BB9A449|nr:MULTISPECIES: tetratricopeptide repeat protein [Bacillus]